MPRDERTYITVHDGMPDHPKVEGLSDAAFRLMVETWCWCSRNRTDGKVRASSWSKRGTARARAELLREGLVVTTDDGVIVHDYTEHQRTAAEIDELKEKRREAGSKGGKAKANAMASATANGKHVGSKLVAESETDTEPLTTSGVQPRKRGHRLPDNWVPTVADIEWARARRIPDDAARRSTERFRNHWLDATGKTATKLDWSRAWRNWLDTDAERGSRTAPATATDKVVGIYAAGEQAKQLIRQAAEQHALPGA